MSQGIDLVDIYCEYQRSSTNHICETGEPTGVRPTNILTHEFVSKMLDQLCEIELTMPKDGERKLNPHYLDILQQSLAPDLWKIASKIVEATQYIPFSKLLLELQTQFASCKRAIGDKPFYLYLPPALKSTLIFAGHFWKEIQEMNFQGFFYNFSRIHENMNILVIDDCMYSGRSICAIIDRCSIGMGTERSRYPFRGTWHLVLGYSGERVMTAMPLFAKKFKQNINIYCQNIVPEIPFTDKERDLLVDKLYSERYGPIPIYFDHKIAGTTSSYPSVYETTYAGKDICMVTHPPYDVKELAMKCPLVEQYITYGFEDIYHFPSLFNVFYGGTRTCD